MSKKEQKKDENEVLVKDARDADWFYIDNLFIDKYLPKVGASVFTVYCCFCRHADKTTQKCHPSQRLIGEETGLSKTKINECVKTLVFLNMIEKKRIGRMCNNRYKMLNRKIWRDKITVEYIGNNSKFKGEVREIDITSEVRLTDFNGAPCVFQWYVQNTSIVTRLKETKLISDNLCAGAQVSENKNNSLGSETLGQEETPTKKITDKNPDTLGQENSAPKNSTENSSEEKFDLVKYLMSDKKRHVVLIGYMALIKKMTAKNVAQAGAIIALHSKYLCPLLEEEREHTDKEIIELMHWLNKNGPEDWGMSTVSKYIYKNKLVPFNQQSSFPKHNPSAGIAAQIMASKQKNNN